MTTQEAYETVKAHISRCVRCGGRGKITKDITLGDGPAVWQDSPCPTCADAIAALEAMHRDRIGLGKQILIDGNTIGQLRADQEASHAINKSLQGELEAANKRAETADASLVKYIHFLEEANKRAELEGRE